MPLTEDSLIRSIAEFAALDGEVDAETPLFSSGALDSVAMLNLIMYVERETGTEIRAEDVTLENFDTASRILDFARKLAA
ncbi:MAG: phosphopantetheine-containing protein [Novosphingobium pentaromativorans]|uniref:Phosphopantetheine-containing protein n=1 Tax=Novosphingobium pentaromativorans TaxID=205844 RepID=A0A2W5NXK5_9SPHN|nr:MAG: phosphopantetheine-containing protein [Novosphingobium pentaromativorans]